MSRTASMAVLLLVAGAISFAGLPAYADQVPAASYSIYGTLSISDLSNSNACAGTACVETLTYSFTLDSFAYDFLTGTGCTSQAIGGPCYASQVVGPILVSSSGPLGYFAASSVTCCDAGFYIAFFNAGQSLNAGDEIDLYIGNGNRTLAPGENGFSGDGSSPAPFAAFSTLNACQTQACSNDFLDGQTLGGRAYNLYQSPAEFTATQLPVPEPSIRALLAFGMLAILAVIRFLGNYFVTGIRLSSS